MLGMPAWTSPVVPADWLSAIQASSRSLQPMAAIVDELLRKSAGK
jgi:hypothetical protein